MSPRKKAAPIADGFCRRCEHEGYFGPTAAQAKEARACPCDCHTAFRIVTAPSAA